MLRVWYSYCISVFTSGSFVYGLALGGVVASFGRLTHVSAITHNLLAVPLSSVPAYVWNATVSAVASGELLTVVVTLILVGLSIGALVQLRTLSLLRFNPA